MKRGWITGITAGMVLILLATAVHAARGYDCEVDDCSELIGLWHLDETSGNATDASGRESEGTIVGATQGVDGRIGKAVSFDGSSNYIDLTSTGRLRVTGTNVSVSAWVNTTTSAAVGMIYQRTSQTLGNCLEHTDGYLLRMASGKFTYSVQKAQTDNPITSDQSINDGTWHHLVGAWNGTTSKIYLDGQLVKTAATAISNIGGTTVHPATIGAADCYDGGLNTFGYFYGGKIDEVSAWNKTLNSSMILKMYNIGTMSISNESSFTTASGTTDFETVANMSNISQMVLATTDSRIQWQLTVNAFGQDYDEHVTMGSGFVSVNASALDASLNASANVSVSVASCDSWTIYHSTVPVTSLSELKSQGTAVGSGEGSSGSCTSYCSNPVCVDGVLNFTVTGFDGAGGQGGTTVTIPEFSTWLMLIIALGIVTAGITRLRKR